MSNNPNIATVTSIDDFVKGLVEINSKSNLVRRIDVNCWTDLTSGKKIWSYEAVFNGKPYLILESKIQVDKVLSEKLFYIGINNGFQKPYNKRNNTMWLQYS